MSTDRKALAERLDRAAEIIETGDQRLLAHDGNAGGQPPDISLAEWRELYRCIVKARAAATALREEGEPATLGPTTWGNRSARFRCGARGPTRRFTEIPPPSTATPIPRMRAMNADEREKLRETYEPIMDRAKANGYTVEERACMAWVLSQPEVRLALLEAEEESGAELTWRPIATAPKDGSMFFAILNPTFRAAGPYATEDVVLCAWDEDQWYDPGTGEYGDWFRPTHWMPIPPSPDNAPQPEPEEGEPEHVGWVTYDGRRDSCHWCRRPWSEHKIDGPYAACPKEALKHREREARHDADAVLRERIEVLEGRVEKLERWAVDDERPVGARFPEPDSEPEPFVLHRDREMDRLTEKAVKEHVEREFVEPERDEGREPPTLLTDEECNKAWRIFRKLDAVEDPYAVPRVVEHFLRLRSRPSEGPLMKALLAMRRTDGKGGFLNCWCDSEYGRKHEYPREHAPYCDGARQAVKNAFLESLRTKEGDDATD